MPKVVNENKCSPSTPTILASNRCCETDSLNLILKSLPDFWWPLVTLIITLLLIHKFGEKVANLIDGLKEYNHENNTVRSSPLEELAKDSADRDNYSSYTEKSDKQKETGQQQKINEQTVLNNLKKLEPLSKFQIQVGGSVERFPFRRSDKKVIKLDGVLSGDATLFLVIIASSNNVKKAQSDLIQAVISSRSKWSSRGYIIYGLLVIQKGTDLVLNKNFYVKVEIDEKNNIVSGKDIEKDITDFMKMSIS
jgi:hypothetical protein